MKLDISAVRAEAAKLLASMTGVDRVHTLDDIIAGRAGENAEALRRNTVVSAAGDLLVEVAPGFEIIEDFNESSPTAGHTGMVQCTAAATAPVFILAPNVAAQTIGTPSTPARLLRPSHGYCAFARQTVLPLLPSSSQKVSTGQYYFPNNS